MNQTVAKRSKRLKRALACLLLILVAAPALLMALTVAPGPNNEDKIIVIPRGTPGRTIAALLDDNGVLYSKLAFYLAAKLGPSRIVKAGEYKFPPHVTPVAIAAMMRDGQSVVRLFTVAEGLTSAEIVALLQNTPALSGDIASIPGEGTLLPETYRYSFGDSRAAILTRMQKAMQEAVSTAWDKRDPAVPLQSPQQAVIMASVVEKETGKAEERPRVAAVFYNRLAVNMRLQSDPTVIYALTAGRGPLNRELTHEDMATFSPYNTYTSDGLPPKPICNPGRASLDAALHPEKNDFLYFVANGTGGHAFSKDLNEHNRNITHWMQNRDKPASKTR